MALDPRAKRFLDMLALSAPDASQKLSAAGRRDAFAKLMQIGERHVAIARTEDIVLAGPGGPLPLRLYDSKPDRDGPAPALVFLHGGGLVAGSIDTHDGICRMLANASGTIVISVDYRLAPEAPFPAGLIDAGFAIDWINRSASRNGIDPLRIAVGGESAGALLAALICNGHQAVSTRPRAQLLLCPVVDLAATFPSRQMFAHGHLIDDATIARDIDHCLPQGADATSLPSPLREGEPARAPATIIVAAECDPFRDEAAHLADMLAAHGVPVQHTCHPGMVHGFYGLNGLFPQADKALQAAGQQLAALLA